MRTQSCSVPPPPSKDTAPPADITPIGPKTLGLTGDSDIVQSVCMMVAKSLHRNPRRLKQFINVFRRRAFIADAAGYLRTEPAFTMEQLGKFVLISLRWPDLLSESAIDHGQLFRLEQYASDRVKKDDLQARDWWWASQKDLVDLLKFGTAKAPGQDSKFRFENVNVAAPACVPVVHA